MSISRDTIRTKIYEVAGVQPNTYVVNADDLRTIAPKIKSADPKAVLKVVDPKKTSLTTSQTITTESEEQTTDESYNIYAICTKSTGETQGNDKWERCVKSLKGKEGYKLGESVNPRMTKQELIETVMNLTKK